MVWIWDVAVLKALHTKLRRNSITIHDAFGDLVVRITDDGEEEDLLIKFRSLWDVQAISRCRLLVGDGMQTHSMRANMVSLFSMVLYVRISLLHVRRGDGSFGVLESVT